MNIDKKIKIKQKRVQNNRSHIALNTCLLTEVLFSDIYFSCKWHKWLLFFIYSLKFCFWNHRTRTKYQLPKYIRFQLLRIKKPLSLNKVA